jgi:hypothetical protein
MQNSSGIKLLLRDEILKTLMNCSNFYAAKFSLKGYMDPICLIIKHKSLHSQVPLQGGAHIKECET